jgi:hypothetical protein
LETFLGDESNKGTYTCLTVQEYPLSGKKWFCNSYRVTPQYDEKPFENEFIDEDTTSYDWETASAKWASIIITYTAPEIDQWV